MEVLKTIAEFKEDLPRELVMKIAFQDSSPYVRREALIFMKDADANDRAALQDASPIVREFAATRFPRNHPVRIRMALSDTDPVLRSGLAGLIDDPIVLKQIVQESRDPKVRWIAIGKLDDKEFVGRLAANDPDPEIRRRAEERMRVLEKKR